MLRERKKVSLKTAVRSVRCILSDEDYLKDLKATEDYIKEELNACVLDLSVEDSSVHLSLVLNFQLLGPRLGKRMQAVQAAAKELTQEELRRFEVERQIDIGGVVVKEEEASLVRSFGHKEDPNVLVHGDRNVLVMMDFTPDPELQRKAIAREVANRVQKVRKQLQLQPNDAVLMFAGSSDPSLASVLIEETSFIDSCLRRKLLALNDEKRLNSSDIMHEETVFIGDAPLTLVFVKQ